MDDWEALLESLDDYHDQNNPNKFLKMIRVAESVMAEDLAPFEIEFFLSTLIENPVNVRREVQIRQTQDEWEMCIMEAFKLLSNIIDKYNQAEVYFEDFASLCFFNYDAKTKQLALTCLRSMAQQSVIGARNLPAHVLALEEKTICKAPLALLIGTICEYHPEVISRENNMMNKIWRIYLNMLDCNKHSPAIKKSVLQGILGLFKYFGDELTTMELSGFYEKLVNCLRVSRCEDVCLSILEKFSHLFRERLSNDVSARKYLWVLLNNKNIKVRAAILSVYEAVVNTVKEEKLQDIFAELQGHTNSSFYVKFTALHALTNIHTRKGLGDLNEYVDVHKVEFEIRNGNIGYEICEAVTWCVQSNVTFSDRLLQTSLLSYDSFPVNKRTDLLQCFVRADEYVRKSAVVILLTNAQTSIWKDLFNSTDNILLEYRHCVAEDVQEYVLFALETVGEGMGVLPDNIKSHLSILTLASRHRTGPARVLLKYAKKYPEVIPSAVLCGDIFDENISIQNCVNDEDKMQSSLSYIQIEKYKVSEMIIALETILSRSNTEATDSLKALNRLEKCIQGKEITDYLLCDMIRKIHLISRRLDKSKKEDRVLEREITLFLAKYGRTVESVNQNNVFIKELENGLVLDLQTTDNLKLNLQSVFNAAVLHEDRDALVMLLNIIYNKLIIRKDPTLQGALMRVIVSLSHCDISCDVIRSAVLLCGSCVLKLLQYIIQEKSNKSRQVLLDALKILLTCEENNSLENVLENVLVTEYDLKNPAISELLELLIKILEDNNTLSKKYLPDIILKILKLECNAQVLKMAADTFTDKIELYELNTIDDIILKVVNMKCYEKSIIKASMEFIKKIFDKKKNRKNVIDYLEYETNMNLMVLMELNRVFVLDSEGRRRLLRDFRIVDGLFNDYYDDESIFEFCGEFAAVIIDAKGEETFKFISKAIDSLTPEKIIYIKNELSVCLSSLKVINNENYIKYIMPSVGNLLKSYPVDIITERIQKYIFPPHDEVVVNTLNILLEFAGVPLELKPWVKWVMKVHTTGFIERNLKSKMEYLMDLIEGSMRFLTQDDIKELILEGDFVDGISFFQTFLPVTYKYLIKKPFILILPGMEKCNVLLRDIVKHSVKRNIKEEIDDVAELITQFNSIALKEKLILLVSLQHVSPDVQEVIENGIERLKVDDKIQVIMAANNKDLKLYKYLTSHLPSRISELSKTTASCFRLILDMFDMSDDQLTSVVVTLAANDKTKGWWDDAIHMCMSTVAKSVNVETLNNVYRKCFDARTTAACERVLVPLLRYSKPGDCEEFFSINLENIVALLKEIPKASHHATYDKCIVSYVKVLYVIQVIFEKVPKQNIESPRSVLYSNFTGTNFVSTICKLCFTLRSKVDKSYRSFHCANYNCLVSAICLRDPKHQVYATVFNHEVWTTLIDEEEIRLPLREQWNQSITRHATSSELIEVDLTLRTSSVRTRMFTRTLSEHPFQYDLVQEEGEIQPQELHLVDNPLNRHPCIAALTALLRKKNALEGQTCIGLLINALQSETIHVNVKWLLTQAICNSVEELKTHASNLQPALLSVIINTSKDNKLNGIHVDILDTLILWNVNTDNPSTNEVIDYIIQTAIEYKHRKGIYAMLVDKLVKLLSVWPNVKISWSFFEKHIDAKNLDVLKVLLNLLKNILQSNKYIPELLPALTKEIVGGRSFLEMSEVYGKALNLERNNYIYLKSFQSVLSQRRSNVNDYIKLLFYVQKGYPQCCDAANFCIIADLVPKLPKGREKLQCLKILANCVRNVKSDVVADRFETIELKNYLDTAEGLSLAKNGLDSMSESLRKDIVTAVCEKQYHRQMFKDAAGLLIVALKLHITSEGEPPAKRLARESKSLLICGEYTRNILKVLSQGDIREVGEVLNEDLGVRLCESFYIAILLSKSKSEDSLCAMLQLFFHKIKEDATNTKPRDEIRPSSSSMKLLNETAMDANESNTSITMELTTGEILTCLLKFCKKSSQTSLSLITQLMRCYAKGPGFNSIRDDVVKSLNSSYVMEIVRAADIWRFEGLKQIIEDILETSRGTEAEDLATLLYEDFKLREFIPKYFVLGSPFEFDENMTDSPITFSIEDLMSTFGKLSNWDDLTLQQKKSLKNDLPCLWTDEENFENSLKDIYQVKPTWLNAMISAYKNKGFNCHEAYKWPKNYFDVSVIAETSSWGEIRKTNDVNIVILNDIHASDCMAQWAGRIMMRSVFLRSLNQLDSEDVSRLSRSHSAMWCERASEMTLHEQVLQCCKIVTVGLHESETLKWIRLRMLALRGIALEKNDRDSLMTTLDAAESHIPKLIGKSNMEDFFGMQQVSLLLRKDLNLLEKSNIDDNIMRIKKNVTKTISKENRQNLEAICMLSMSFYDNWAGTGTKGENDIEILSNLSKILTLYVKLNLGEKSKLLADVIINRLDQWEVLRDIEAESVLDALSPIIDKLSTISVDTLKSRMNLFTAEHDVKTYLKVQESKVGKYNKCLSLVGDPEYLLLQYCDQLDKENDAEEWGKIFDNMKNAIFENPYAGPDYQVLNKYKGELYGIAIFDLERKREVLPKLKLQLKPPRRDYLHLSQLCPTLTSSADIEDDCLKELLCLKPGVNIVRFEEKIPVFKDSVRRPSVLRCRLTDGRTVQCIVKRGESVRTHCAAVAVVGVLALKGGYRVTPLSEDCCLIEYLENYERFRSLISSAFPIDNIPEVNKRMKDDELVLDPKRSLQQFKAICCKVPPYILRSAIEATCVSVEDFICKKKNFFESICDMTVSSYLCDMSDRHMENMMYNTRDGSACHVDCGAVLQHGGRAELPPARLTRNVLGLCDALVLESRLQTKLSKIRGNQNLLLPSLSVIYTWMGQRDKLPYISDLIKGTTLSHYKTMDVVSKTNVSDKEKYIQVFKEIFEDFNEKQLYSVEEQVTSLLRQSTDDRILSLTRSLWEPWV